jgi:hypothetical protein
MVRFQLLAVLIWVLAFLAGRHIWVAPVPTESSPTVYRAPLVVGIEDTAAEAEPHLDVHGNQVDEAVGDYRVDPLGDLYERHSPDTALLKLGAPGV